MSDWAVTAQAAIVAATDVTNLVGTNYWPEERANDELPALTYRDIAENRYDHLDGPGKGKRVRIQFDCWGATRASADALADTLEIALSQTGRIVFRQSTKDLEAQTWRTIVDWSVFIANPT